MAGRKYTNQPQLSARIQRNNKLFDTAMDNETRGPFGGTVLGKLSNRAVGMFADPEDASVIRAATKAARILKERRKAK